MTRRLPLTVALVAAGSCWSGAAHANGFNRIGDLVTPVLIVFGAVVFPALALLPALLVYLVARRATRQRGGFAAAFLGAALGGELGIGASVVIWKLFTTPGQWSSLHYTLYPPLIGALTLAGAVAGVCISIRGRRSTGPP